MPALKSFLARILAALGFESSALVLLFVCLPAQHSLPFEGTWRLQSERLPGFLLQSGLQIFLCQPSPPGLQVVHVALKNRTTEAPEGLLVEPSVGCCLPLPPIHQCKPGKDMPHGEPLWFEIPVPDKNASDHVQSVFLTYTPPQGTTVWC